MNRKICYQKPQVGFDGILEGDMVRLLDKAMGVVGMAALAAALGAGPAQAHRSDWGLPLVGGLVGGAGLTALYYHHQQSEERAQQAPVQAVQPVYVTPAAPAPAVPSATSIEDKLNVLDQLAAKGYITQDQYQARRQALLDQL